MKYFIAYLLLLGAIIFFINWLAKKEIINKQHARKATHTLTGILAFSFPFLLTKPQIIILSAVFVVIMSVAKLKKILVLNTVERKTWGEVYFPASVGICAFIGLPHNLNAYLIAILCLTFADTAANIVGNIASLKVIKIGTQTKSIGGTLACIIITFIIFALFHPLNNNAWLSILFVSILIGLIEMLSIYGTDNLTVPVSATLLSLLLNQLGI
jgi:dolichol kinase